MNTYKNPLGYKSIPSLLLSMAWPAITANIVNAIYNIVDQIFIGHGVGFLGNAATNIAFPLTAICLSVGTMIGIGAASNFNLSLGKGDDEKARKIAANAVTYLFISGIIICALVIIFLKDLMIIFGATEQILDYAMTFSRITSLGIPFLLISLGTNPLVRADGSPKYSMYSIVIGAILNIILNPIFIFIFKWGIAGSAWATVISQIISAIILLCYFLKFKTVKFEKNDFIPHISHLKSIITLGMTSFIFQSSNMLILVITNNLLNSYGNSSIYGSDIPIAVAGIVSKINVIFIAIIIGLVQGAQPILGFNYGAKNFERVRQTIKLMLKIATIISVIAFSLFEIFPKEIISIFGDGDELYFEFGIKYMRIYLLLTFLNGIQISSSTFFSSLGKAKIGSFLSLTKQIIILLPLLIIFPKFLGINGIIFATPTADLLSFIVASTLLIRELKLMPHK